MICAMRVSMPAFSFTAGAGAFGFAGFHPPLLFQGLAPLRKFGGRSAAELLATKPLLTALFSIVWPSCALSAAPAAVQGKKGPRVAAGPSVCRGGSPP